MMQCSAAAVRRALKGWEGATRRGALTGRRLRAAPKQNGKPKRPPKPATGAGGRALGRAVLGRAAACWAGCM